MKRVLKMDEVGQLEFALKMGKMCIEKADDFLLAKFGKRVESNQEAINQMDNALKTCELLYDLSEV